MISPTLWRKEVKISCQIGGSNSSALWSNINWAQEWCFRPKYNLYQRQVRYLGHLVSADGYSNDPGDLEPVTVLKTYPLYLAMYGDRWISADIAIAFVRRSKFLYDLF
ncbi:hypothetical protein CHS0354_004494 [Potamilus streckersoni]|uniref:Uncharacterized protein n=1 Tax=Potamilus streckersoni TaxID=2493646 RepID=A0AAE0SP38_9BIVA|nr:hypothetical protein CHS0354_004494 [Potamilus streckersoni]